MECQSCRYRYGEGGGDEECQPAICVEAMVVGRSNWEGGKRFGKWKESFGQSDASEYRFESSATMEVLNFIFFCDRWHVIRLNLGVQKVIRMVS